MNHQKSGTRRTATWVVSAGIAAIALAGCGSGSTVTQPSASPTTSSSAPSTSSGERADGAADLLAAVRTALQAVPDSTLISIESEDGGARWEVQVVSADGTEYEVDVSSDGSSVISGPREKTEDAADKAKHRDRVAAATLGYEAAVAKLLEQVPAGTITELNLDSQQGRTVWEADVIDTSNKKHEVDVDAASGEILADEVSG